MKTYVRQLTLRGFKSFNRKVDIVFQPGLNCIMGPNGSGKSNVLDSLCFILGRMSSKDLRAENFADLLFKRKGTIASEGEVSIVLDNTSKIFPLEEKTVEIKRKIKKTGQTQFKINGKNATRQQALDLLAMAKIFPDGHNIILQGDIAKFADLKPLDRRHLIEELSGISIYEEKKNKALNELGKVDERLKEVNIILKEKEAYLKNLDEEKKGAETYRDLQENIKKFQSGELNLRLSYAAEKRDKSAAEIEAKLVDINNAKLDLEINGKKIAQFKQSLEKLEREIQKKGGEESLRLQKEVENLRVEVAKVRTSIATSLNEIGRVEKRETDLKLSSVNIEDKLKDKLAEKSRLESELLELQKQEVALKKGSVADLKSLENDVNRLELEIDSAKAKRDKTTGRIQELRADIQITENELEIVKTRISQIKSSTKDFSEAKDKQKKLEEEVRKLANQDSQIALQLGGLRKEIIKAEELLTKNRILAKGSQEALMRDNAIRLLKDKAPSGVYGTVAELGSVSQQHATALSIAAGNRMRNVVVDSVDTAIKCLAMLKNARAGVATFLPLDKLKMPADNVPDAAFKKQGVLGFAHELIDCEPKYKKVFRYIFRDTLVVQNIDIAKALGVGKFRMVTLDGDLFEASGAITGGFRAQAGIVFESAAKFDVEKLASELESLKSEFESLETERNSINEKLFDVRKEKAEIDAKAELFGKGQLAKDITDLEKQIQKFQTNIEKNTAEVKDLEKTLAQLEEDISIKTSDRNFAKTQLHDAQFGDSASRAEELQAKRTSLESALAAAKATIENALQPEKENILRVLKELEKEKKTFQQQISEEETRVKDLDAQLEEKEKEQEAFHGKLKLAFEEQAGLSNNLRETETAYNSNLLQLNKAEQDRNNFAIEKAQHDAEVTALEEELQPFAGIEPVQFKTLEEAKRKIRDTQAKLEALGNVNLRALEIYEDVLKNYNELATRVSKLQEEKTSVLQIIDEVEKKKTETFMKSYDDINAFFASIYGKINTKYNAEMLLESPDSPFEGGIAVNIFDGKNKRVSVASLSGGEKVLVALAFIFAIQENEPASFYLLDEIDAALDKLNSEKVAKLLKEYSSKAQVMIISHNDSVISESATLYGVHMNQNGESSVVSLKL